MVNKSLILAFSALAAAAPQLGALGGLGGLGGLSSLKPGSKAASADKAAPSGETIPDGLNYNKPLEDDDDNKDWSNWEYNEEDYIEDPHLSLRPGAGLLVRPDPVIALHPVHSPDLRLRAVADPGLRPQPRLDTADLLVLAPA